MLILVGLGANLGDTHSTLVAARDGLARHGEIVAVSSLWRSTAIGPQQPDFLNAALLLHTRSHPLALLESCQQLEGAAGRNRQREPRWGPRPLDLDLLMASGYVISGPTLTLPHPRLHLRRFALGPAAELTPEWVHPRCHRTLASLAADPALQGQACRVVGAFPAVC